MVKKVITVILANFFEIKLKVMMDHHVGGGDTSNIWFS
jgi:hypothetical protein